MKMEGKAEGIGGEVTEDTGSATERITGGRGKLGNEELHNLLLKLTWWCVRVI
jgi:hypothetical protein